MAKIARSLGEWLADPLLFPCDACQEYHGVRRPYRVQRTEHRTVWLCATCYGVHSAADTK